MRLFMHLSSPRIEPDRRSLVRQILTWTGRRLRVVVLLLCVFNTISASAADMVLLLSSSANGDYPEVVSAFTQRLATAPAPQPLVKVIDAEAGTAALTATLTATPPALIVAIGSVAARLAHAAPRTQPVLDILVPRLLYAQLPVTGSAQSALYIDQPFERQLNLCRLIVPDLHRLAVLYGPDSRDYDRDLRRDARRLDIRLTTGQVAAGANPNAALDAVLDDNQLLLAVPDPTVFNRYTVAGLLLTAYHHGVPIVGFSAAYVKAGALAAVYSTPEQIGREAAEMVLAAHEGGHWTLPAPRYPSYYNVAVNRQVGRSLNLKLPDEADLERALTQQEHTPQ